VADPIISDDGRWLWNGKEWVPNPPKVTAPPPPMPSPMPHPTVPNLQANSVPSQVQKIQHNQVVYSKIYSQSRAWAFCTFHWWAKLFFPKTLIVTPTGIQTFERRGVILFWLSDEETMDKHMISSVRVKKGIFWDLVTIDTTGGTNVLQLHGMNKTQANALKTDIQALINSRFQ